MKIILVDNQDVVVVTHEFGPIVAKMLLWRIFGKSSGLSPENYSRSLDQADIIIGDLETVLEDGSQSTRSQGPVLPPLSV